MTRPMARLFSALERFHAAHPWDHNAHYHRWILRQSPVRAGRALDAGCGSGDLVRLLAARANAVDGVDLDPVIVGRARELTDPASPVTYTVGDVLSVMPPGPYDVITCVATLHHLPFGEALERFRERLAPGGTLVVVGVARAHSRGDHLIGLAAIPSNVVMAWVRNRGRRAPRPASMTAPTRDAAMTYAEITAEARRLLPGARLRRRLFWRYTLVWQRS